MKEPVRTAHRSELPTGRHRVKNLTPGVRPLRGDLPVLAGMFPVGTDLQEYFAALERRNGACFYVLGSNRLIRMDPVSGIGSEEWQ